MRTTTFLRLLPLTLIALSGCDSVRDTLGFQHQTPDEFSVATAPPLAIPPDYTLRPPAPGAMPSQAVTADAQAQAALGTNSGTNAKRAATPGTTSTGEAALLQQAGSGQTTARDTTATYDTASLGSSSERQRLETALFATPTASGQANGQASGQNAPTITLHDKSLFGWL